MVWWMNKFFAALGLGVSLIIVSIAVTGIGIWISDRIHNKKMKKVVFEVMTDALKDKMTAVAYRDKYNRLFCRSCMYKISGEKLKEFNMDDAKIYVLPTHYSRQTCSCCNASFYEDYDIKIRPSKKEK